MDVVIDHNIAVIHIRQNILFICGHYMMFIAVENIFNWVISFYLIPFNASDYF